MIHIMEDGLILMSGWHQLSFKVIHGILYFNDSFSIDFRLWGPRSKNIFTHNSIVAKCMGENIVHSHLYIASISVSYFSDTDFRLSFRVGPAEWCISHNSRRCRTGRYYFYCKFATAITEHSQLERHAKFYTRIDIPDFIRFQKRLPSSPVRREKPFSSIVNFSTYRVHIYNQNIVSSTGSR